MQAENNNIAGRFKDSPWFNENPSILIAGTGGIGSNTAYCIAKSIPCKLYLIDNDVVEEHNVGTQLFRIGDIGQKKVDSLSNSLKQYGALGAIYTIPTKIDSSSYCPITISAFDNMKARKQLFEIWESKGDRELLIDGRLRASMYEIYIVVPGREEEYRKTLFDDDEVDEGPCTFKQTTHFGMLIGARITQIVANFLTNKNVGMDIASVPFYISEVGEPLLMTIK